jgi:hypothetical protein
MSREIYRCIKSTNQTTTYAYKMTIKQNENGTTTNDNSSTKAIYTSSAYTPLQQPTYYCALYSVSCRFLLLLLVIGAIRTTTRTRKIRSKCTNPGTSSCIAPLTHHLLSSNEPISDAHQERSFLCTLFPTYCALYSVSVSSSSLSSEQ